MYEKLTFFPHGAINQPYNELKNKHGINNGKGLVKSYEPSGSLLPELIPDSVA